MKPDIFLYLNYREYLKDALGHLKNTEAGFSYRELSKSLGYTSPNFPQLIVQGKRYLDTKGVLNFSKALGLNKSETDFFETLVLYNQAKTHEEKEHYFKKIAQSPGFNQAKPLEKSKYKYFEHWYHPVIFELADHPEFKGDPKWLAQRIFPRISLSQITSSLNLLVKIGLLEKNAKTQMYTKTLKTIKTESEVSYLAVSKYHKNLIELAKESIDSISSTKRDIRGVTLKISPEKYSFVKKKMETFWKEMVELSEIPEETDEVYQINLQLFPLTKNSRGKK